jgi:alcohol dehydrogenase class IV
VISGGDEREGAKAEEVASFIWREGDRVVLFRHEGLDAAARLLGEHGYDDFELLTTPRHLPAAPELEAAARAVHAVDPGPVPEAAARLLDRIESERLVAFGGGRVIDTAKAVAAVREGRVAAIPTTLSGAELTAIHRLPAGAEGRTAGLVRPELVIADPAAMTGLAEPALRATAMNALAHGADSLCTPFTNPLSRMAALRGAELIAGALDEERAERERGALALGSLLCAHAIDSALFGVHHVVCQTLVRVCGTPHAETNAVVLPEAMALMSTRAPAAMGALAAALGTGPERLRERIRALGGEPAGLGELGADRSRLGEALEQILARRELGFTPRPPGREELEQLIERAW